MIEIKRLPLGVGYYSRAEAARLLRVHPATLNRWVRGYTYQMRAKGKLIQRARPALIRLDLPTIDHAMALSFVELMELRTIKALVERNIPIQRIRTSASAAIEIFGTSHPFASRRIFTDRRDIFAEVAQDTDVPDVIELKEGRHLQIHSGEILRPILEEISFSPETSLANRWWPLARAFPVVLDPKIAFGAPVVEGTSTRSDVVAAMAKVVSADVAANVYSLTKRQVEASVQFEELLAA
ncbi:MAG: hypothetical protein HYY46_05850 [Deltaproteobacteria bacterium]|nr:hypothetical protein [Deltaproteobacteria bacterium]